MRKTEPRRHSWIGQGKPRKALPVVNVERAKQRDAKRTKAHRLFLRSDARKAVDARAQGQCEWTTIVPVIIGGEMEYRCTETEGLEYDHLEYPDVPGGETPEMVRRHCKRHHHFRERTEHPTRRNGRLPRG